MKNLFFIALLFVAFFLQSCGSSKKGSAFDASVFETAKIRYPKIQLTDLQQGFDIYTNACQRCHGDKGIAKYNEDQWNKILVKMIPKAKLNEEQSVQLKQFILSSVDKTKSLNN